jgi:hypothetical protein
MITKEEVESLIDLYGFDESLAFEFSLSVIDLRVGGFEDEAIELKERQIKLIKEIVREREISDMEFEEFNEMYNSYLD